MMKKSQKKPSTLRDLARLLRENERKVSLRESSSDKDSDLEGEDSLDAQIDKYLVNYESEAKNLQKEGMNFRMMTRRFLLEEEDTDEETNSEGTDESEADAESKPEKLTFEDINVKSFVTDVMRLVDNYDSLLEIQNTILRRAAKYLKKGYDEETVTAFKDEILESYGIEIGVSKSEKEDSLEFQPPKAAAAGPMGGSA